MHYLSYFPNNNPNEKTIKSYGFSKANERWICEKDAITPGFRFVYSINGRSCDVTVYDLDSGWEYDLFNVPTSTGETVTALREEADAFLQMVSESCYGVHRFRDEVLDYCKKKYGTLPDSPFEDFEALVLRKPSGKWYGLIMTIPSDRLHLPKRENVDVLNLKATPERIAAVDKISVFPAWHMNKKYWLTVLMDSTIEPDYLHALIDESYQLVK